MTGGRKYVDAFNLLVKETRVRHELMYPKLQFGRVSFNQSDDEMAFMSFYSLSNSPESHRQGNGYVLVQELLDVERYELQSVPQFAYAGVAADMQYKDPYSIIDLAPKGRGLTIRRYAACVFPLTAATGGIPTSNRKDILPLPGYTQDLATQPARDTRRNGYVIPVDECYFNHYNYGPWDLEMGGQGSEVGV